MHLQGRKVQALVDTGASQNYMAPSTANSLGLKSKASETKSVVLADGKTVTTNKCVTTEFLIEAADTSGTKQILFCDKCGAQHLDAGWYSKVPHKWHKCEHCGKKFTNTKKSIGV